MDHQEAEDRIVKLVSAIDVARQLGDMKAVERIEAEIQELKKTTGPRKLVGKGSGR